MKNTEITINNKSQDEIETAVTQWFEIALNAIEFLIPHCAISSGVESTTTPEKT